MRYRKKLSIHRGMDYIYRKKLFHSIDFTHKTLNPPETQRRAVNLIYAFLSHTKDTRQLILSGRNFYKQICLIQSRARLQIALYRQFQNDIIARMNDNLTQGNLRMLENKSLQKKYPEFRGDLANLQDTFKLQAINDMMAIYKVQHTI